MNLLYHHNDNFSIFVFRVLIIGLFATSTTYIYGTLLTANGNLKELNKMAFITMLINIGLNLLLIPHFQALGSAFSSITAQLFAAFFQIYLSIKIFHFQINKKFLFQLALLLFIAAIIVSHFIPNWLVGAVIIGIICAIIILLSRAIDIKMFLSVIRSKTTKSEE
jgi:O-antigen/teichoic acid export membrane protein